MTAAIPLTAAWVAAQMGGAIAAGNPAAEFSNVSIDTRTLKAGELYVGIRGDRFDGAEFAGAAIEAGAAGIVVPSGSAAARSASRSGQEVAGRAPVVIEVADTTVALQALAQLPDAWLWIAGSGPEEARLKAMATALGLEPRVRFLGWRDDPSALYRAADVCVFPSRYEPLGNVVIQAWAHGLPVVAAESQGPKALIEPGKDGLLTTIDDADALAQGVRRLLADKDLRAQIAGHGKRRVELEFSEAAVVAQWRTLFADYGAI